MATAKPKPNRKVIPFARLRPKATKVVLVQAPSQHSSVVPITHRITLPRAPWEPDGLVEKVSY